MGDVDHLRDKKRLAAQQRLRRSRMHRIDYTISEEALSVLEQRRLQSHPGSVDATNSAVLNAIVCDWARLMGIKKPQKSRRQSQASSAGVWRPERARTNEFGVLPELPHASRARVRAYDSGPRARSSFENKEKRYPRQECGACRHRDRLPCRARTEPGKKRCRFHGGRSTGPRSAEGKARSIANLRQFRPRQG